MSACSRINRRPHQTVTINADPSLPSHFMDMAGKPRKQHAERKTPNQPGRNEGCADRRGKFQPGIVAELDMGASIDRCGFGFQRRFRVLAQHTHAGIQQPYLVLQGVQALVGLLTRRLLSGIGKGRIAFRDQFVGVRGEAVAVDG
ncbi:conserved hypothetical protein [Rhizobium johnstonii 3841]|uniref:Uncharacterized protein n=1 Tax=Rhizobium johnstonii (strain DSM 114642 / LMG 32736 / 3841) TaxID=216596 RepID=Q1MGG5_RHIJ3|nr:conserved hypothetical protein [Rhizobium johnstonii 3841]